MMNKDRAQRLRQGVWQAYSAVANHPPSQHPFPVGRAFAQTLGYPPDLLDNLPATAVEAFAGVSNLAIWADLPAGSTVLDLGCGAGLDSLIAARRVGPKGRVIGLDFSQAMLARARQAAAEARPGHTTFIQAAAECISLADESIDVALVNGIFNLNPGRSLIFEELARLLRPGGVVFGVELILKEPLPQPAQADENNWFA